MMSIRTLRKIGVTCATLVAFIGSSIVMTGCKTAALIGVIAGAGTVVAIVVVAKYKANEAQKAAAAERARAATLALAAKAPVTARHPKEQAAAKRLNKKADPEALATVVEKPQPEKKAGVAAIPARHVPTADEMEEAITHKIPAYLAVPVPKQEIAAEAKGEATYMLWDTHRQQLVTDDVYVLKHDVRAGVTVKLDGVKAQVASAE